MMTRWDLIAGVVSAIVHEVLILLILGQGSFAPTLGMPANDGGCDA